MPRPVPSSPFGPVIVLSAGLLLSACAADTVQPSPLEWQKVVGSGTGGSVLGDGAPGAFDEITNFTARDFRDGDEIRLYYGGSDADTGTGPGGGCAGINSTHWRIGLAGIDGGLDHTGLARAPRR